MPTGGRKPKSPSLSDILEGLLKAQVDFILVGGLAAVIQGAPVTTIEVDIVYSQSRENIAKRLAFLKSVDAIHRRLDGKMIEPKERDLSGKGQVLIDEYAEAYQWNSPEELPHFPTLRVGVIPQEKPFWDQAVVETTNKIIAPSGLFFARLKDVFFRGEHSSIHIETGMDILLGSFARGLSHQVLNFTKLDSSDRVPTLITGPYGGGENFPCYMSHLLPSEKGIS